LSSSKQKERAAVGAAIREACLDKGFFYCVGHGVPQGLIDAVFAQSKAFFDQPEDIKRKTFTGDPRAGRGYEEMRGQTLQAGAAPDNKEGYKIGYPLPHDDPRILDGRFSRAENIWPEDLPGFEPVMIAYSAAMHVFGTRLVAGLALSLGMEPKEFDNFCKEPISSLRLLHYPPHPPQAGENEFGAGAHTDFGGLTLLMQDDVGGLQVFDQNTDTWLDAPYIPGAYIVNLGDMIARWTNNRYRSTLHRVINRSGRERYSIPYFFTGNPDHVVACLPSCLEPGEEPKYAPTTVEKHMLEMINQTFGLT